jgi:hypothetical protein
MKDKVARHAVESLANRLGCGIDWDSSPHAYSIAGCRTLSELQTKIANLSDEVTVLHGRVNKMEENILPTCKSCGQKIQDGFKPGDIDKLASEAKKKR